VIRKRCIVAYDTENGATLITRLEVWGLESAVSSRCEHFVCSNFLYVSSFYSLDIDVIYISQENFPFRRTFSTQNGYLSHKICFVDGFILGINLVYNTS
jgi:hypothetical protein